jgi:mannose-6-phosphate isomerase-like protein (cupin superfamily)
VSGARWRVTRLEDVPDGWRLPDGTAVDEDEALAAIERRDPRAIARWGAFEESFPGIWERLQVHDLRTFLGIRAFGVAAFTASAGDPLIVPHSETAEGYDQEELYAVVVGRARFVCDGEEVELAPGSVLYVAADVHREGYALESPTTVLVVGGIPGEAYEPPPFHLEAGS